MRTAAVNHEIQRRLAGFTEEYAYVMCSNKELVCPEGWAYLKACGYFPKTPGATYTLLVSLSQKEALDRTGLMVSESLDSLLLYPLHASVKRHIKQISRLLQQLPVKRHLTTLRNKIGKILFSFDDTATKTVSCCQNVMSQQAAPKELCLAYVAPLFNNKHMPQLVNTLIKPLSLDVGHAALDTLNESSEGTRRQRLCPNNARCFRNVLEFYHCLRRGVGVP